jgi:hypothetical protein
MLTLTAACLLSLFSCTFLLFFHPHPDFTFSLSLLLSLFHIIFHISFFPVFFIYGIPKQYIQRKWLTNKRKDVGYDMWNLQFPSACSVSWISSVQPLTDHVSHITQNYGAFQTPFTEFTRLCHISGGSALASEVGIWGPGLVSSEFVWDKY